nr:MAG TPA: hypothetical protein [Caudoviricetes sp.]
MARPEGFEGGACSARVPRVPSFSFGIKFSGVAPSLRRGVSPSGPGNTTRFMPCLFLANHVCVDIITLFGLSGLDSCTHVHYSVVSTRLAQEKFV